MAAVASASAAILVAPLPRCAMNSLLGNACSIAPWEASHDGGSLGALAQVARRMGVKASKKSFEDVFIVFYSCIGKNGQDRYVDCTAVEDIACHIHLKVKHRSVHNEASCSAYSLTRYPCQGIGKAFCGTLVYSIPGKSQIDRS